MARKEWLDFSEAVRLSRTFIQIFQNPGVVEVYCNQDAAEAYLRHWIRPEQPVVQNVVLTAVFRVFRAGSYDTQSPRDRGPAALGHETGTRGPYLSLSFRFLSRLQDLSLYASGTILYFSP